jgi:hypothetical protein
MWFDVIARLICRLRGHVPTFFNVTSPIPGVTITSECRRCHRGVEQAAAVATGTVLRLVKPKDAVE